MARFLHQYFSPSSVRRPRLALASFWVSGILFGILAAFSAGESLLSLMRTVPTAGVSIVSVLCAHLLPFLLSAAAVSFSGHLFLFPIAFFKGLCFAFVSMGITMTFGCAGWLYRLFLCFTDLMCMPLLYSFWLCCLEDRDSLAYHGILTGSVVLLFGSMEYRLILPFLADLIKSIER